VFHADSVKPKDSVFIKAQGKEIYSNYRFSYDGTTIATLEDDPLPKRIPDIFFFSYPEGILGKVFPAAIGSPKALEYAHHSKILATIESDSFIVFYDSLGSLNQNIPIAPTKALALQYSANDKYIVVGCKDSTIKVYDIASRQLVFTYDSLEGSITGLDNSRDGKYILASTNNGFVYLLKSIEQLAVHERESHANDQKTISIFPNPSAERINLEFTPDNSQRTLSVFDALGRELMRKAIPSAENTLDIKVKTLPEGIYYVRLGEQSGKFMVVK